MMNESLYLLKFHEIHITVHKQNDAVFQTCQRESNVSKEFANPVKLIRFKVMQNKEPCGQAIPLQNNSGLPHSRYYRINQFVGLCVLDESVGRFQGHLGVTPRSIINVSSFSLIPLDKSLSQCVALLAIFIRHRHFIPTFDCFEHSI